MFEQVPSTIFIAVGTIAAAMISGTVAFLNLIISKEQSVSEFRQKWIDSLRDELAIYLSACNSISVHTQVKSAKHAESTITMEEMIEPLHEYLNSAYSMYHRIMLRLNPNEHKELSEKINDLEKALSKRNILTDPKTFGYMCDDINLAAQVLLKSEWERVKQGETTYRVLKVVSAIFALSGVLGAVLIVWNLGQGT